MEYTTERGITVNVTPIPMLLDEIRKATPFPDQPTYTEHLAGGATQDVVISDADALAWARENPESWAEHAEAWATFEQERDAAQSLLNERIWQAVMLRAVQVDLPKSDDWIEEQAELGLTVPEGKRERRIHYIRTEVIGGLKDSLKMTALANGTDISEEALSLAESSFRGDLARQMLEGLKDKARALAAQLEGGADESGEGVEDSPE
jgi:hypothetical protein